MNLIYLIIYQTTLKNEMPIWQLRKRKATTEFGVYKILAPKYENNAVLYKLCFRVNLIKYKGTF